MLGSCVEQTQSCVLALMFRKMLVLSGVVSTSKVSLGEASMSALRSIWIQAQPPSALELCGPASLYVPAPQGTKRAKGTVQAKPFLGCFTSNTVFASPQCSVLSSAGPTIVPTPPRRPRS